MGEVRPYARTTLPADVVFSDIRERDWKLLCEEVAQGVPVREACADLLIPYRSYRAALRESRVFREQLEAARAEWDNRNWSEELVEEICQRVACGETLKAVAKDKGFEVSGFHALRLRDPYVEEMFDQARRIQAEGWVDEMVEISDDTAQDVIEGSTGAKANTSGPQRARVQVETRKWLASKLLSKIYGDKVAVDQKLEVTLNHAEQLEEARARREQAHRLIAEQSRG